MESIRASWKNWASSSQDSLWGSIPSPIHQGKNWKSKKKNEASNLLENLIAFFV
jgi:hypothetical protein